MATGNVLRRTLSSGVNRITTPVKDGPSGLQPSHEGLSKYGQGLGDLGGPGPPEVRLVFSFSSALVWTTVCSVVPWPSGPVQRIHYCTVHSTHPNRRMAVALSLLSKISLASGNVWWTFFTLFIFFAVLNQYFVLFWHCAYHIFPVMPSTGNRPGPGVVVK